MSELTLIQAQRAGFIAGLRAVNRGWWGSVELAPAEILAAHTYPIPTIERPRVVKVRSLHGPRWDLEYRVEKGQLQSRCVGPHGREPWKPSPQTVESLNALLGLFANPTETVEIS